MIRKIAFCMVLAAFAAAVAPVAQAGSNCSYTMDSGKARWSCK